MDLLLLAKLPPNLFEIFEHCELLLRSFHWPQATGSIQDLCMASSFG